eukprot:TRINITY_DN4586_c0_g1_i1.p1 TRINITY_DN4586_c0_g1~~TRINITY_DN4586_c0_g1_i1.p1  ORF type:complete len:283 (+),score=114.97 TRINITY_DN4586_c0_g1_i1:78-926(+)
MAEAAVPEVGKDGLTKLPNIRYWNNKGSHGEGPMADVLERTLVPWQALIRVMRGWKKNPVQGWYFRPLGEWPQQDGFPGGSLGVPRHLQGGSPGRLSRMPEQLTGGPGLLQRAIEKEAGAAEELFRDMDVNSNGKLSLAEVDKYIHENSEQYDHKPALMRAMKRAERAGNRDGLLELPEFTDFIAFLAEYTNMWKVFEDIDSGHDRRINPEEFRNAIQKVGVDVPDPDAAFREADRNGGGEILFDEFCYWLAEKKHVSALATTDGLVGYVDSTGAVVGEGGA